MTIWQEKISRGLAVALMNNFTSVADALKELVDNPFDYRQGQQLRVDIVHDLRRDRLVVESDGGRGMGADDIAVWLNWGEGEEHDSSHIGRWHQGGKAACGFLARHVRLWAKRRGSNEIWFFGDEDWATRSQPKNFGEPRPLPTEQWPESMRDLPLNRGHIRIELTKLVRDKRGNLEVLKRALSNTYRYLLEDGAAHITINGDDVGPLNIPLSTATKKVDIPLIKLSGGRSVRGWAARMKRDQLTTSLKGGLRLIYNGRLIVESEWFGYNYGGKGSLNSLIGELHMKGFTPNPNKTDFVDRGDHVWDELGQQVLRELQPLIAELRRSGEESRVTKKEKERVGEVAAELEEVLTSVNETSGLETSSSRGGEPTEPGSGGRSRGSANKPRQEVQKPRGRNTKPRQPRTPPPEDPVGSITRLLAKITGGKGRPPLRVRAWDSTERSAWTTEGTQVWLDINTNYALYISLRGAKPYLAETAILELCGPREGESMLASDYIGKVNLLLLKWAQVAGRTES